MYEPGIADAFRSERCINPGNPQPPEIPPPIPPIPVGIAQCSPHRFSRRS